MKINKYLPLAFFLIAYIAPLNLRPLITPDEFRYAEIPRAMLESGDFVSPRLLGVRYFEKPALGYQITAVSMALFGDTRFAARFPQALAAGLTALLIYGFVRRKTGNEEDAAFGSLLYLASGFVFGIGTFAVLDSLTTLFTTGCLIFYFTAIDDPAWKKRTGWLLLSGVCCGLAFLTKGFLAFAVPAATVVPYLIWSRKFKLFYTTPWPVLAAACVVAAPWSLLIHLREPYFWNYFFWVEHVQRFFHETPGQHASPFWILLPPLAGGVFPGALTALGAFVVLKRHFRELLRSDFIRILLCWTVLPFLLFSASTGKLATYIMPCFPPLTMLLALGAKRYLDEGGRKWLTVPLKIFFILLLIAGFGFIIVQTAIYPVFSGHENAKWLTMLAAVCLWCLAMKAGGGISEKKLPHFFMGLAIVFAIGQWVIPDEILAGKAQERGVRHAARLIPYNATVVADSNVMHAVGYLMDPAPGFFGAEAGELADSVEKTFNSEYGDRLYSYPRLIKLIAGKDRAPVVVIIRIKPDKYENDRSEYIRDLKAEPLFDDYYDEIWTAIF
ncbi:MAG: phospholipid carrier-dependent glycosyltransferase [Victivallaceae bacterium]|nr:phospholipid carrier-dependent glycosyltransferase [Victivallaceae bacterium]